MAGAIRKLLINPRGPFLAAAIYWLAIEVSWNFAAHDGTYIAFWLPAGIFVGLLIASEMSDWLTLCGVMVATNIAFDYSHGAHLLYASGMAASDLLEACIGALIFRRLFPTARKIETLREFLGFVGAILVGSSIGALGGATTQLQLGFAQGLVGTWKTWMLGDGMAAIVVAPVIFEWVTTSPSLRDFRLARVAEAVALAVTLGLTIVLLFRGHLGVFSPNKGVIIPFMLWAALRFGPRGVALGNLFTTLMVVYFSGRASDGTFGAQTGAELATMQIFLAVCSAVGFISSFALSERNRALQNLKDSEERLRTLTIAANEAIVICEDGRIIDANDQALLLFRDTREGLIGRKAVEFVEGEAQSTVAAAMNEGRELLLQQRLRRTDGSHFEAESHGKKMRIGGRDLRLTTIRDISAQKRNEGLFAAQARILEMIAKGFDRDSILSQLLAFAQEQTSGLAGLVLMKDETGCARIGGEHLPAGFPAAVEKFFQAEQGVQWLRRLAPSVTVEAVTSGPLWGSLLEPFSQFPKTCWSVPVEKNDCERFGVFLFFSQTSTVPDEQQKRLLEIVSYLASLVMERDAVQAARDQASSLMRATFEATSDAVLVVDMQGRVTAYNQNFVALWGLTPDVIESRSDELALQSVISQVEEPTRFLERVAMLYADPKLESFDVLRLKDGRTIERSSRPQRLGHRIIGRVWSFHDVTEQTRASEAIRLSEERFRLTFENAGTGMALFTMDRRFAQVNTALCELLGYRAEELVGHSPSEFTHPDDQAFDTKMAQQLLSGEAKICRWEKRYIRRDGSHIWTSVTTSLLRAADGTPEYFSAQIKDMTERKRFEEAMRENERKLAIARDQAVESSRLKSEFLATMSHEIRTPMNAIIGMTSLLTATSLDREQSEMASLVANAAENLLVIINDILDFSRIEAGYLRIEAMNFDLRQVLSDTVSLLTTRARPKGLELVLNLETLPEGVYVGDPGRIRQILTNLIGNAIKFTETGSVSVDFELLSDTKTETSFRISVADTGIGIPADQQGMLFQPFVQVDGSSTRRFGGTGLGLAITRHLVEAMGGQIGLHSELGVGSTFWFEMKIARRPLGKAVAEGRGLAKRILYVDDDENDRDLISHLIRQCGYEIEVAETASNALKKVRTSDAGRFDLILLDWKMPGMDGFELARQLRGEPNASRTPFVMLSSVDRPRESGGESTTAEFSAFLSKSIDRPRMAQSLHHLFSAVEKASAPANGAGPDRAEPAVKKRRLKILMAEDNQINQRVGTLMLAQMGHDSHLVGDGQAAVDRLNDEHFDVVLMDCQMPVLDGFEATRLIRQSSKQPGIPIIALTAYARSEDKARCIEAGMTAYVSKPLRMESLQAIFDECGLGAVADYE